MFWLWLLCRRSDCRPYQHRPKRKGQDSRKAMVFIFAIFVASLWTVLSQMVKP